MKRINIPTLLAISIVAWILVNVLHEIAGHAGMAFLTGLNVKAVNTTTAFVEANWENEIANTGFFKLRLFLAGGVLINLISWISGYLVLKFNKSANPQMRTFLWLFASFSYVVVVMNLVTAPLTGGGDFAGIINTVDNKSMAKAIVLTGGLLYAILGYRLLQQVFLPKLKRSQLGTIALLPVVAIIILQSLSLIRSPFAYLPPESNHFLFSLFAYFHFLIWAIFVIFIPASNLNNKTEHIFPGKSITWMIIGIAMGLFYVLIIGPGIGSFEGHPIL